MSMNHFLQDIEMISIEQIKWWRCWVLPPGPNRLLWKEFITIAPSLTARSSKKYRCEKKINKHLQVTIFFSPDPLLQLPHVLSRFDSNLVDTFIISARRNFVAIPMTDLG